MSTPREIIDRIHACFLDGDVDGIADLLAEDIVVENPFAPAGIPARIEGRETFRAHLAERLGRTPVRFDRFESTTVHQTTDPDVIIVEARLSGRLPATGQPFTRAYIQVVRTRGGRIAHWRDYFDPTGLDRLPEAGRG